MSRFLTPKTSYAKIRVAVMQFKGSEICEKISLEQKIKRRVSFYAMGQPNVKNNQNKPSKLWDVIVIGAGASGMMAAITAARQGRRVLVLEHMDKPGKKLLATGNGRCNYTNENMGLEYYHGNKELVKNIMPYFRNYDTVNFFMKIGIYPRIKNGYYYPFSNQALSVVEALTLELDRLNVQLVTSCEVNEIKPDAKGFLIRTSTGNYRGRKVIVATGLRASEKLGSDGSMFPVLKELGHRFVPILPALCGFEAKGMDFKKVSGVRAQVQLALVVDGCHSLHGDDGELQLTDYGISGIPVFQISSKAARALYEKKKAAVEIDFMTYFDRGMMRDELTRRFARDKGYRTLAQSLCGLLHSKLIPEILKKAGLNPNMDAGALADSGIQRLAELIKCYPVELTKVRDFSTAQVCSGGIRSEEIDTQTLESRLVPGLYFAGEILDVDGICGGYNLQWAWSSGYVAGMLGKPVKCLSYQHHD